jgi:hypothetical protein
MNKSAHVAKIPLLTESAEVAKIPLLTESAHVTIGVSPLTE